ncbi:hypothetical protein LUR56_15005 [Streptomyces sp. MT29]|nr:hypothetical protein [Streptomyces sp. MT29]
MRSPRRFRCAALAALTAGALFAVAGCDSAADRTTKGTTGTAEAEDVLLQPLAEPGPGPFTKSTARQAPSPSAAPSPQEGDGSATRTVHRVSGAVPGLYGGVRSDASCDVEQQARLLTADQDKARAFAEEAGIEAVQIPGYLRSLTPVTLRADTQVTNHGYSAGSVTAFQAVLQAGTAVLVDSKGLPRVRCACGNPLERPVIAKGQVTHRGERWAGYDPARILAVDPGVKPLTSLIIVNTADNTWIERASATASARPDSGRPAALRAERGPALPVPGPSLRSRTDGIRPVGPVPRRTGGDGVPGVPGRPRRTAPRLPAAHGARPRHRGAGRLRRHAERRALGDGGGRARRGAGADPGLSRRTPRTRRTRWTRRAGRARRT